MADGAKRLDTGSEQLAQGFVSLANGSEQLSESLKEAAAQSAGVKADDPTLQMYAQPVQLVEQKMNAVPNYGTGSTPYFLALGLLVGSLLAANIIPLHLPAAPKVNGWRYMFGKLGLFYSVGLIQTLLANGVLIFAFGIRPVSVPLMLLYSLIVSFAFMTLIVMLVSLFGTFGRLLGIFLVVTQLATSGGTFPFPLAPEWIQAIGRCLPMTYALRGFHAVVSTGNWDLLWRETGVMIAYIAGFAAVMLIRILTQSANGTLYPQASAAHG
ncbi:YhgE/Pip family protein [Cohnella zeiphila]|uniref:ABC transporter permease n=1 Tax=Cohnella zeiphila TaxID=2761120 RepID=A0A7X0SQG3_9BACL|nr:YhgE/Pip family protein [Cohnella zeiphila]MBB6733020.1 ABC transporter permease [Cohnella zeiphila]